MINWIVLGLAAALAVYLGRRVARRRGVAATATPLGADDPRLELARRRARSEQGHFLSRVQAGDRPCYVALRNREIPEPHLDWARVLELESGELKVEFVGEERQECVPLDAVVDWQIEESDGNISGGYSVRVALDHLLDQTGTGSMRDVEAQRARYRD
ncbi:MAG: hypothetical protein V3W41_00185 [Planctomycetota bacterium]